MRGIPLRGLGSSQVSEWHGVGDLVVPSRTVRPWTFTDPLDSTSGLSNNGVGSWASTGGVLTPTFGDTANPAIRSTTAIDTAKDVHIAQVDFRVSSAHLSGGTESWLAVGFTNSTFSNGYQHGTIRRFSGNQVALLSWGTAWGSAGSWTPTADTWYTLRLVWDDTTDAFTIYANGNLIVGPVTAAQTEGTLYPALGVYRNGTSPTYDFRYLRYWGGSTTDTPPPF